MQPVPLQDSVWCRLHQDSNACSCVDPLGCAWVLGSQTRPREAAPRSGTGRSVARQAVKAVHHVACGYGTQHINGLCHQGWHALSGVQACAISCADTSHCGSMRGDKPPAATRRQAPGRERGAQSVGTWIRIAVCVYGQSCFAAVCVVAGCTAVLCMSGNAGMCLRNTVGPSGCQGSGGECG